MDDLPVSSHADFTPEEMIWAGERAGNIGGGIVLVVVAVAMAHFLARFKWRIPISASSEKLSELDAHKKGYGIELGSIRRVPDPNSRRLCWTTELGSR